MQKPLALAAALALATASLVASPLVAKAASTCALGTPAVTPSRLVVMGLAGEATRTLNVKASDCTAAAAASKRLYWVLQVGDGELGTQPYPALKPVSTSGTTTTFRAVMKISAGNWLAGDISTDIYNSNYDIVKAAPTLQLRRSTQVTTNATPEPIRKGRTLTVSGTVKRANWDTGSYSAYGNHKMDLQFRTPSGSYITIKQIYSSSRGNLKTTVTATQDGCYRYLSKQTSTAGAAVSVGDCVDVT